MKWQCVQECVRSNADLKNGGDACMHYLAFPDEAAHPCTNLLLSAKGDSCMQGSNSASIMLSEHGRLNSNLNSFNVANQVELFAFLNMAYILVVHWCQTNVLLIC